MEAAGNGTDFGDLVYHIHAFNDFAEDAVAVALGRGGAEVQKVVVHKVDEELTRGRVNDLGTGIGKGALKIV